MDNIVQTLTKFSISALLVIGGFEVKKKQKPNNLQISRIKFLVYLSQVLVLFTVLFDI